MLARLQDHDRELTVGPALVGIEVGIGLDQNWPQARAFIGVGLHGGGGPTVGSDCDMPLRRQRLDDDGIAQPGIYGIALDGLFDAALEILAE